MLKRIAKAIRAASRNYERWVWEVTQGDTDALRNLWGGML